jgi:hypothetical protein
MPFLIHIKYLSTSSRYSQIIKTAGRNIMEFRNELGDKAIQDVLQTYPDIGEILSRYDIGCITCKVGICLLKDVVAIHGLSPEDEANIEREINEYLTGKGA